MKNRQYAPARALVTAVVLVAIAAFALLQLASESLESSAAVAGTLPTRVSPRLGDAVYRALDRFAPAPYVESALAARAIATGDLDSAQRYAVKLPASPVRDELLAQVARARGNETLALEYDIAADDIDAVQGAAERAAATDPAAGYALDRVLQRRLEQSATHPDALAEVHWRTGLLANRTAWRMVPGSPLQRAWLRRALAEFDAAVALAPLSERYVIADANQADLLDQRDRALRLFQAGAQIDPASADAIAGLGVIAWQNGDRASALNYFQRARALDPQSLMVRALQRDLK